MTALYVMSGLGVLWAGSLVVALAVEEGREALAHLFGALVAILAMPVLVLADGLRRAGLVGGVRIDPRTLGRFANLKHKGGGHVVALSYSPRLGVLFVRGLRDNTPADPPPRVRVRDEGAA